MKRMAGYGYDENLADARGLAQRGDPAVLLYSSDPAQAAADSLRTVRLE
jgi:hypothetical protein